MPPPPPPFVDADDEADVGERVIEKLADWVSQEELMRQAKTASHLFCHDEFNPYCKHCCRAHAQRKGRHRGTLGLGPKPTKFGEQTTGDHLVSRARASEVVADEELFLNDDELPDAGEDFDIEFCKLARDAVVMYDRATEFGDMFPKGSRTHEDTLQAFL